jgi:diketogulonate reductase-like aldo/keto reductase
MIDNFLRITSLTQSTAGGYNLLPTPFYGGKFSLIKRSKPMQLTINSTFQLNNGVEIPVLGLGVFRSPAGDTTQSAVLSALQTGYRHVDTARVYGNEASVGEAVRRSGLARNEVFVTTKLWNGDHGYDSTLKACKESLRLMGLDYLDLYLVHWPVQGLRLDTWRAMETLLEQGLCRAVGVSNYMVRHLEELLTHCRVVPAVNQIELTPYNYLFRKELVELCRSQNIQLEAYSPLTKGQKLKDPQLMQIAARYGKSTAQLLIRWVLQQNVVVIPKSVNPERIRQNSEVFDFTISAEDMALLETFNENLITGWNPTNAP